MAATEYSYIRRECRAVQIPEGTPALLSTGTRVRITQALGGSFTVATDRGYLFRIGAADADALGKTPGEILAEPAGGSLEDQIWARLRTCYDPEIPINIVDLGLIYNCEVLEEGRRVDIKMTLTAVGCGMGPILAQEVRERVQSLPGVEQADVEVIFDPPWDQNMMSEAARLELGLF
ncbi:MAG TPA: putative Fe-S cluster assembly protein SufT [Thermoanaerobaculia bacterium]|jgi:probable FeS assembly SUF system protein SufT